MHATIVAHLAADGTPTLSVFSNDTMPTAAGEGRISVRHTAAAPVVDVVLADDTVLGTIANGEAFGMDIPADTYDVYVTPTGGGVAGAVAGPIPLEVIAGTLRTVYAWGDLAGGSFALNIQDFAGFDAATESVGFTGASVTDGVADPTTTIMADAERSVVPRRHRSVPGIRGQDHRSVNVASLPGWRRASTFPQSGAAGMVLFNPTLQGLATDNHFIPSVHVENDAGADIVAFMGSSHRQSPARSHHGEATTVQGDVMACILEPGRHRPETRCQRSQTLRLPVSRSWPATHRCRRTRTGASPDSCSSRFRERRCRRLIRPAQQPWSQERSPTGRLLRSSRHSC